MKKIIFCLQTMVLGGVEKELITVLKLIHNQFDITLLLLYQHEEELLQDIPNNVRIVNCKIDSSYYYASTSDLIKRRIRSGKILEASLIAFKKCFKIGTSGSNINIDAIPTIDEYFDVAICYHIHSPLMFRYTAQKINASKKIAWIHNDFYASGYPIQRLKKIINEYDEFVAVSKKVEKEFRELCSWYSKPISTAYNYLDAQEIRSLSNAKISDNRFLCEKETKILTIGRFSEQKGIDIAIKTAALLKSESLNFNWFLIGYGELEDSFRKLIKEYDVEDCFTILGKKNNPYPYIKNADICVQPSRHEAYPLVLMEAKILKKPIVCTDFDGADEQIISGHNGIIVPLNDTYALCKEISKLVRNPEARDSLSKELENWESEDDLREIIKHLE